MKFLMTMFLNKKINPVRESVRAIRHHVHDKNQNSKRVPASFCNGVNFLFLRFYNQITCWYYKNMISQYIEKKLKGAQYKILKNGVYFGEIPGLRGVWADSSNLEDCRRELQEVLEDWLLLKVRNQEKIPGFTFKIDRRQLVKNA